MESMKVIQILFMMLPANICIDLASNVSNEVLMSIVTLSSNDMHITLGTIHTRAYILYVYCMYKHKEIEKKNYQTQSLEDKIVPQHYEKEIKVICISFSMSSLIRQIPQEALDDVVAGSHPLEGGPAFQYNFLQAVVLYPKT